MSKSNFAASVAALRAVGLAATTRVQLAADVTNPEGDRRCRYDWTHTPVIKAGARFALAYDEDGTVSLFPLKGRMLHAGSPLFLIKAYNALVRVQP